MNYKILRNKRAKSYWASFIPAFLKGWKDSVTLTRKQKIGFILIGCVFCFQLAQTFANPTGFKYKKTQVASFGTAISNYIDEQANLASLIEQATEGDMAEIASEYVNSFEWLDILKKVLSYITEAQLRSVQAINDMKFGSSDMFNYLVIGLTVFACLGCVIRLFKHFLETERHDNVKAITGYFSYAGIFLLFIFSPQISKHIIGLNQPLNVGNIKAVSVEIENNLVGIVIEDFKKYQIAVRPYVEKAKDASEGGVTAIVAKVESGAGKTYTYMTHIIPTSVKCAYYIILGILLTTVLAIPAVIMTIVTKVLLTVMLYATQLVFLLAFIPGFDNLWKSFLTNMLNIILWSPIFNAVMTFIIAVVTVSMGDPTIIGILWMTIIAIVMASQAFTLTTSAAGVIIQGAGAGMAGALGALSGMNAMSLAGQAVSTGTKIGMAGVGMSKFGGASKNIGDMSKNLGDINKSLKK